MSHCGLSLGRGETLGPKPTNLVLILLNSLPNGKILDWSKFKAFADDKIEVMKIIIFVFDRIENIMGKGENAGYQVGIVW